MRVLTVLAAMSAFMLVGPVAHAAEKLHLVIGFETGLEKYLPSDCKMRKSFFTAEEKNRDNFVMEVRGQVQQISQRLFDDPAKIEIEVIPFSLDQVSAYLEAFIAGHGDNEFLPYQIPPKKKTRKIASAYRKVLTDLAAADADRFKGENRYGKVRVADRCAGANAQMLADASQLDFVRAMWNEESMRKMRLEDYLSLVFYYLREKSTTKPAGAESLVPIVFHPSGLWRIIDDSPEVRTSVNQSMTEASRASGALQLAAMGFIAGFVDHKAKGKTLVSPDALGKRDPKYTNKFVRNRRLGIVAGNYLVSPHASQRTLFHELSHYLGIAHVFTEDDTRETKCKEKVQYGDSFWTHFNARTTSAATKQHMCECFFVNNFYADYDGSVALTGDTPLAIRVGRTTQFPVCSKSTAYQSQFPGGDANSRNNLMIYVPDDIPSWSHKSVLTQEQKQLANDMLRSFD